MTSLTPQSSRESVHAPAHADARHTAGAEIERVLERFASVARRASAARGLGGDDVEEVLQEVRIRLWRQGDVGDKLQTLTPAYIYRAAMSAAIDILRRRRTHREHLRAELPPTLAVTGSGEGAADAALESTELLAAVDAAIDEIPSTRRPAVRMHLAGYSRQEIAALMQWSDAKTRNLLYRGLDDLRQRLTARGIHP